MKNAFVQILIATVAGVLASLIVMPLQAPVRPLAEPKLLMVSVDSTGTKKPPWQAPRAAHSIYNITRLILRGSRQSDHA